MQLTMRIRGGTAGVVWIPPPFLAKEDVVSFTFLDTSKTPWLVIYGTLSEFKVWLCWSDSTIELTRMAPNLVNHLPSLIVPKVLTSRSLVHLPVLFDISVFFRSRLLLPIPLPILIARSARRPPWMWALQWVQTYSGFRFSSSPISSLLIVNGLASLINNSLAYVKTIYSCPLLHLPTPASKRVCFVSMKMRVNRSPDGYD